LSPANYIFFSVKGKLQDMRTLDSVT